MLCATSKPRSDFSLFVQVLLREELTSLANIHDICLLEGSGLHMFEFWGDLESVCLHELASPGDLKDHLGESRKLHDRLSIRARGVFQSWVESMKEKVQEQTPLLSNHVIMLPESLFCRRRPAGRPSRTRSLRISLRGSPAIQAAFAALRCCFWPRLSGFGC